MTNEQSATLTSPDGCEKINVPPKVFEAIQEFTKGRKTGEIKLQFKGGNVAGVLGTFCYR